jgi:hypothetical protein
VSLLGWLEWLGSRAGVKKRRLESLFTHVIALPSNQIETPNLPNPTELSSAHLTSLHRSPHFVTLR